MISKTCQCQDHHQIDNDMKDLIATKEVAVVPRGKISPFFHYYCICPLPLVGSPVTLPVTPGLRATAAYRAGYRLG